MNTRFSHLFALTVVIAAAVDSKIANANKYCNKGDNVQQKSAANLDMGGTKCITGPAHPPLHPPGTATKGYVDSADSVLQTKIDTEITARENADAVEATEHLTLRAALTAEVAALRETIAALQSTVAALQLSTCMQQSIHTLGKSEQAPLLSYTTRFNSNTYDAILSNGNKELYLAQIPNILDGSDQSPHHNLIDPTGWSISDGEGWVATITTAEVRGTPFENTPAIRVVVDTPYTGSVGANSTFTLTSSAAASASN